MNKVINLKIIISIPVIIFLTVSKLCAQEKFPVPVCDSNQLFYLQRTSNTNTLIYELNYKNAVLNAQEPIHVYWMKYNEQGQKAELNFLQRKFAYGVKSTLISKDQYKLHLVSYKNYPMYLSKAANNKYYVYATINQKKAIVSRIFVKITGGSLWSPDVEYVEVKGTDPVTGKEVMERLKI